MSLELLNLVKAKATLMRQLDLSDTGELEADAEIERVRDVIDRAAHMNLRLEDVRASMKDRENMERSVSKTDNVTFFSFQISLLNIDQILWRNLLNKHLVDLYC